ncbi:kinase-like domain-containing protein, partial [Paraphoma chrysanthemicola]
MLLPGEEEDPARPSDDETLTEDTDPQRDDRISVEDWSQTGRGSHVDFAYKEVVPLEQGKSNITASSFRYQSRFLGQGAIGNVYETKVQGWKIAHKTIMVSRKISDKDKKEIEILKRLSSQNHMIQLVVYNMMGCLISAITYLHDQRIRHKDLKPSNILLSRERLWLSDFGSATDFSMLSQSATDNERGGTPRYFSPEVTARQENGRASDVFSLGCVLLEIITLHDKGTRDFIREQCSSDQSFHANLDQIDIWCKSQKRRTRYPRRLYYLQHVKTMLRRDPEARPTTEQLLVRFIGYDYGNHQKAKPGIFADCCKRVLVSE